jgi:hypothetical protein
VAGDKAECRGNDAFQCDKLTIDSSGKVLLCRGFGLFLTNSLN